MPASTSRMSRRPTARQRALLLPRRSGRQRRGAARAARRAVRHASAVIINDSFGRPWRRGTAGVAIGAAGLPSLIDLRGQPDLFGRTLQVSIIGFADEIAAAASLVMGQARRGAAGGARARACAGPRRNAGRREPGPSARTRICSDEPGRRAVRRHRRRQARAWPQPRVCRPTICWSSPTPATISSISGSASRPISTRSCTRWPASTIPQLGWGRRDETWSFMETLGALGGETWFRLGDRDLALHVERTRRLRAGETLSADHRRLLPPSRHRRRACCR